MCIKCRMIGSKFGAYFPDSLQSKKDAMEYFVGHDMEVELHEPKKATDGAQPFAWVKFGTA